MKPAIKVDKVRTGSASRMKEEEYVAGLPSNWIYLNRELRKLLII